MPLPTASTLAVAALLILVLLFPSQVDDFLGNPQIFDIVSPHISFGQSEKPVTLGAGLDDLFEGQVHPRVAVDQVAVQGLAVLELDQHGVALGGREKT